MAKLLFDKEAYPELTYDDVFMLPNNPILSRIKELVGEDEMEHIVCLHEEAEKMYKISNTYFKDTGKFDKRKTKKAAQVNKEFMNALIGLVASYPNLAEIASRDSVDFRPMPIDVGGKMIRYGNLPIFISNMNTAVGTRMMEAGMRAGAIPVLSQDASDEKILQTSKIQQNADLLYRTPTLVEEDTKMVELKNLLHKRDFDGKAVVVDEDGKFLSVIDYKDMPERKTQDDTVRDFPKVANPVTAKEGIKARKALSILRKSHVKFLPILDGEGKVIGALTEKSIAMSLRYKPNVNKNTGGLSFAVAVPALRKKVGDRVKFLLDNGVDCIVLDTAHFDQKLLGYKNLSETADIISNSGQQVVLVAGNVVTAEATKRVIGAGADLAKSGIGPGSMCTTRVETGVGRPQFSTVIECAETAESLGKGIVADGGIRFPRDIALAIAARARYVMFGSLFAGTLESPPDMEFDQNGKMYKESAGMASRQESNKRRYDKAEKDITKIIRDILGHRAEGVSGAHIAVNDIRKSAGDLIHYMMDGVTSGMTYVDAEDLLELAENAEIGIQTPSGYKEGEPKLILSV